MGYEVVLVLLDKSDHKFLKMGEKSYGSVVATIDLCKCDLANETMEKEHGVPVYYYAPTGDGNTHVEVDRYGKDMKAVPAQIILDAIKASKDSKGKNPYRRYVMAIPLLQKFIKTFGDRAWVTTFGH